MGCVGINGPDAFVANTYSSLMVRISQKVSIILSCPKTFDLLIII
jgi:hypothetical protein